MAGSAGSLGAAGGEAGETAIGGTGGAGNAGGASGGRGGAGRGAAGSSGTGNAAGVTSTGGSSGRSSGGSAGSGTCGCAAGEYCRSGNCYACSDLSRLDFESPKELLDHPSGGLRFPRPSAGDTTLFFTFLGPAKRELWRWDTSGTTAPFSLGDASTEQRSGLYFIPPPAFPSFNVLFDQGEVAERSLLVANYYGGTLIDVTAAPAPLGPSGADDYSVTLASDTERAYWMTTRDGVPALVTSTIAGDAPAVVELGVPNVGTDAVVCARAGDDAAPWVTPDGRLLLFSALPMNSDCEPLDGNATDLYVALLDAANGQPRATAVPLGDVNTTSGTSSETDASLSNDWCTLYLASDGGDAQGHDFRLYRSARR